MEIICAIIMCSIILVGIYAVFELLTYENDDTHSRTMR